MAILAGWVIATATVIMRFRPDLLAERLGPRKGAEPWDVAIMSILGLTQPAPDVVAGLDQRYGWSGEFSIPDQAAAALVCVLGYTLVVWATASNPFLSQIAPVQPERGQTVISSGPYRYIRHPAYLGAIAFELAAPILLDSWWAMIPGVVGAVLLVVRTALEDRMLRAGLAGYADCADGVHRRLVPAVW